ncbi:MAG: Patatin-like phospholipase family protein [Actinomycetota bacterium]|nr:Patatin-like phospholipase family protein [Actinomycetota bacterium]
MAIVSITSCRMWPFSTRWSTEVPCLRVITRCATRILARCRGRGLRTDYRAATASKDYRAVVAKRTVGFALGGGGARGSFSAGALDYLIREAGLIPKVITGTSAGAICASVLAQARTPEEFHTAATVLRDDVIRMGVPGVAFEPQPWLTGLEGTPLAVDVRELMAGTMRPTIPADPTLAEDVLADATDGAKVTAMAQGLDVARSVVSGLAMTHKAIKGLSANAQSLAVIDPLGEAFLGKTPGQGPAPLDLAAIAREGLELRLTVTALNAGRVRYVTQFGAMVEQDGVTPVPGDPSPGVVEGVLASSSVPMVFAPRPIGDDVYVDGGVLQNIPVAPAFALGATDVYAVLADSLECPAPEVDYATTNMFSVLLRSQVYVTLYGQQRRDLAMHRPDGTRLIVIDPTILAIGLFETEPGLMNINIDYGWLRACGETSKLRDDDRARAHELADLIVTGRLRSWYLEHGIGEDTGTDGSEGSGSGAARALESAKRLVATSLAEWRAMGLTLPAKADTWSVQPEVA